MQLELNSLENVIAIVQIVIAIFCLTYAYDILILHRRFKSLGEELVKHIRWFIAGIFITIGSFALASFGKALIYFNIAEAVGILLIGIYFRKCMHKFFIHHPIHIQK